MRTHIDGHVVFNTIMMLGSNRKLVLVLEGDEDSNVVDSYLNDDECVSMPAHGKVNALCVAQLASENSAEKIFFAVDRDFDDAAALRRLHPRISVSDSYDLHAELLLKCPNTARRLVNSHADREALKADSRSRDVLGLLVQISSPVGLLRHYSHKSRSGLKLGDFPFHDLLDDYENGTFIERMVRVAIQRSSGHSVNEKTLVADISTLISLPGHNPLHYCQGHDMIGALTAFVTRRWGGSIARKFMAESMRSAVSFACFRQASIYRDFKLWGEEIGIEVWSSND